MSCDHDPTRHARALRAEFKDDQWPRLNEIIKEVCEKFKINSESIDGKRLKLISSDEIAGVPTELFRKGVNEVRCKIWCREEVDILFQKKVKTWVNKILKGSSKPEKNSKTKEISYGLLKKLTFAEVFKVGKFGLLTHVPIHCPSGYPKPKD